MSGEVKEENLFSSNYFAVNESMTPATSATISQLNNALFATPTIPVQGRCMYTASLPNELTSNFPEGTILQILPDSTILAVPPINNSTNCNSDIFKNSYPSGIISDLITTTPSESQKSEIPTGSEGNMSDIDLGFLTETEESTSKSLNDSEVRDLQSMINIVQPNSLNGFQSNSQNIFENNRNNTPNEQESSTHTKELSPDVVTIDVSKPIQLSQNSLIMVNGRKCVLQQDTETGQVLAYPVKEPDRPRRKRGRPRKSSPEPVDNDNSVDNETANFSEEEKEKGLLQIVNDDGSLVRRSSRKRKKAKALKDYETGNLKQELGSDLEDTYGLDEFEIQNRKKKHKGPGRPKKSFSPPEIKSSPIDENKRPRGRPKKPIPEKEQTQAFLVQTADGQTLMMQVPISSIPVGLSLEEVAQNIANKLNIGLTMSNNSTGGNNASEDNLKNTDSEIVINESTSENCVEPALQDHSVGSTTTLQEVIMDSMGESVEINKVDRKSILFVTSTAKKENIVITQ